MGLVEYLRRLYGFPQVEFEIMTPEGDKVTIWEGAIHRENIATVYRQHRRSLTDVEV